MYNSDGGDILFTGLRYLEEMITDPSVPAISIMVLTYVGVLAWYFLFGGDYNYKGRR